MPYKEFGKRVREQRQLAKMTQEKLAEKAGVSFAFVGHIERGTRKASLDTVVKLANALKISPNILLQDSLDEDLLGEGPELTDKDRRRIREIYGQIMKYSAEIAEENKEEKE